MSRNIILRCRRLYFDAALSALFTAALLWPSASFAQSANTVLGYITTIGCPNGAASCFMPFNNANPLPVSGGGGGVVAQGSPSTVPWVQAEQGSALSTVGITPTTASNAAALVPKNSPGNLYHLECVNATATLGYLIEYNATAAPASATVLTNALILGCHILPASGSYEPAHSPGPPKAFSNGITILLSSTSCSGATVTYTTGAVTGFLEAEVR